jgi:hypothetical protein
MSFAIGLVIGMLVGAGLVYWAKRIEESISSDAGIFCEHQE